METHGRYYDFSERGCNLRNMQENNGIGVATFQNPGAEIGNSALLYQKCVECPDYGVSCNGPKLAALGDIMTVRNFHREIRDRRTIPMKLIHLAAQPISESTINDYFSHSEKDFKWTTVGCIDNALTAICGNRVGKPLLDNPCPASSSEIQQQQAEAIRRFADLEARCQKLQGKLEVADEAKEKALHDQEQAYNKNIAYLKELAEKRFNLLLVRDRTILFLSILCALFFAGFLSYLVWDIMHPGVGLFRW